MYSFITCFSAIVIIAELCSADRRIVGGKEININEVPYQVSLVRNGRHWCGGALLSKKFVLTAAHCTLDNPITHVRVGSSHQDEGGELIEVFESIEHPQYNKYSAYDFDIAILRLNDSQAFPEIHSFAKIPRRNSELKVGELTIVSGWGDTKNPLESPKHLRAAKVPIISQASCKKVYKKSLTENMFCAGYSDGGIDSCQGDSGGPLIRIRDDTLVGIVSWGVGCALADRPGVYTRVTAARKWIKKITGI